VIAVPALSKSTVPVGEPAPGAFTDTVAVNVNCWFAPAGLADETKPVEVCATFTC
jgi:hypothetical protein